MKQLIIFITLLAGNTWAESPVQPSFTEPYTGKPVKEYEIELPITRSERQKFSIPADCSKLNNHLVAGAGRWGNLIERRMWLKISDDCSYYVFLNNQGKPAEHDFVSQYDFYNADMADLPLYRGCDPNLFFTNPSACPPKMPGLADFDQFVNRNVNEHDSSHRTCNFENGVFRGHIVYDGFGMHCLSSQHMPGFRILSVQFADVNNDNYQDAVLRLIPIGPGNGPAPTLLPLTRTSLEDGFSIPKNALFPTLGPASRR